MIRRFLGSATASAAIIAVLLITQPPAAGQTASPASKAATKTTPVAKPWTQSRTLDGKPNLEGIWNTATVTPLERPKGLGAKEFYSVEEFAKLSQHIRQGEVGEESELGAAR